MVFSDPCPFMQIIKSTNGHFIRVDVEFWITHSKFNWKVKKGSYGLYAYRTEIINGKPKAFFMHREIAKTQKGFVTHHKNRNTLDNRKRNLETMTDFDHKMIHQRNRISKFENPISR
jgi:hypothetical protein